MPFTSPEQPLLFNIDLKRYTTYSFSTYPLAEAHQRRVTADIMFLLDGSQYVGQTNFYNEKTFIKSIVGRLKINWHKSHIGVATYGSRALLRVSFRKHVCLGRALEAINRVSYPQETERHVYGALKTSLRFFSKCFARKILVSIVDARHIRLSWSLLSHLQSQFKHHGVRLFVAAVGLPKHQALSMNRYLKSIAQNKGNIFLILFLGSAIWSPKRPSWRRQYGRRRYDLCVHVYMLNCQPAKYYFSSLTVKTKQHKRVSPHPISSF